MFFRAFIKGSTFVGSIWFSGLAVGKILMDRPTSSAPKPLYDPSAQEAQEVYKELMLGWWPSQ